MFLVTIQGNNDVPLFLVDRTVTKDRWWTSDPDQAMHFRKRSAAEVQSNKLTYKNPGVISLDDAYEIAVEQDEEHPFSPDGHGQS